MRTAIDYPDKTWTSDDLNDETLYNSLATKLDNIGKLIVLDETKPDILHTCKHRVYGLPKGIVGILETINTSLNQYVVNVRIDIYSNSDRTAKKLLEDILKRKTA